METPIKIPITEAYLTTFRHSLDLIKIGKPFVPAALLLFITSFLARGLWLFFAEQFITSSYSFFNFTIIFPSILIIFAAAPLAVAIHRWILLSEQPDLNVFKSFFQKNEKEYALLMLVFILIPDLISKFIFFLFGTNLTSGLFSLIIYIGFFYIGLRICLLFPIIAIDSFSREKLTYSFIQTKNIIVPIFVTCFLLGITFIIVMAGTVGILTFIGSLTFGLPGIDILSLFISSAFLPFIVIISSVYLSLLYQFLHD
ncbi:MAG: hypothetical protein K1X44_05785 [Alphaproteobacteria bacterium]|nr:hypothetical protein [Alphaproteobacteria bacterium]